MIDHQVKSQCIATQKSERKPLPQEDLDHRFVENQLDAHYDLFDHGVVFRQYASEALVPVLDQARQIIEQHIGRCKELRQQFTGADQDGLETEKAPAGNDGYFSLS